MTTPAVLGYAFARDAVPTVTTTAQRNSRYPAPPVGFKVYNVETASWERYTGAGWATVIPGDAVTGLWDVRSFGILDDGTTDQTAALVAMLAAAPFNAAEFAGILFIPFGVKFNYVTVTAAFPPGLMVIDQSGINYQYNGTYSGTGTGYHAKTLVLVADDGRANADTAGVIRSGHNTTLLLHNVGTGEDSPGVPSESAANRIETIAYGVDRRASGDPLYTFFQEVRKSTVALGPNFKWCWRINSLSSYAGYVANIETATRFGLLFELDEDGQVNIGTEGVQDGVMLQVVQSPFRNGGADTETIAVIKNTNTSGVAEIRFAGKTGGGVATGKGFRLLTDNRFAIRDQANSNSLWDIDDSGNTRQNGNLTLQVAGNGLAIKEGSNASSGLAVLVGGTVVVATTKVTANSRIHLTSNVPGGTPGFLRVSARTAGTSFTILSSSGTDTSSVAWFLVEPAP